MSKKTNSGSLKILGFVMIAYALVYGLLGTLSLTGTVRGVLPGHEAQEVLVIVLAYGVALLTLICGIACIRGSRNTAKITGLVFAVLGLVSQCYLLITGNGLNIFDVLAIVLGVCIYILTNKTE